MDPKKLLTADYLDIIYDHHNKKYGGYELRKHYDRRLKKAVVLALTSVAAVLSFSFINANHKGAVVLRTVDSAYTLSDVPLPQAPPPPKPPVIPPSPPPPAQHVRTAAFSDPVITRDDLADKPMTENKDLTDAHTGTENHDGDVADIRPDVSGKTGKGTGIGQTGNDKSNEPLVIVQQMPQFIGDMGAYLDRNLHYPDAARSAGIEGRVVIKFIVNEDGSVSDATVLRGIGGGCDEEALRIVKNMPKWKPGKQNGTPVKVYFVLPIKFELR